MYQQNHSILANDPCSGHRQNLVERFCQNLIHLGCLAYSRTGYLTEYSM
jgi:hypothetical protein